MILDAVQYQAAPHLGRTDVMIRMNDSLEIETIRVLRGPSLWSDQTVIEATVRCSPLAPPALAELSRWMDSVIGAHSTTVDPSKAPDPVAGELSLASLLLQLTVALQRAAGCPVELARLVHMQAAEHYRVIFQYSEEAVGTRALQYAAEALRTWTTVDASQVDQEIAALRRIDQAERLGPSTAAIARAARKRGIPVARLSDGSLLRLGQGARQRRVWAAETDRTSSVAESIAQDKELTKSLLHSVGIPVPRGRSCRTLEQVWETALRVGLPVVVKPRKGNQGRDVSVNLGTREAVEAAFRLAARQDGEVIIERTIAGSDFRVLVVGSRVVAAARRVPPQVVGDGIHSVRELVEQGNRDPRRGEDHATVLSLLRLDEIGLETLEEQGFGPESVPASGTAVLLRRNANLSTGGTAVDVTDSLHPEVAARAVEAAQMVGLDVAGIDVVASRVDIPLEESGGAIIEVNAAPGLRMHLEPSEGTPRAVGEALVASMIGPGDKARIPVVAVTGTNGKTTTVRCVAQLLRGAGLTVGMTCTDGIFVNDARLDTGDCSGPRSARAVLGHPDVEAAVLETARGGLLREGLGVDLCDVAVVTNLAEGDHLGLGGIETLADLARVKAIPVRCVSPSGAAVLNAADPVVAAMAAECPGRVIYFCRDADHPVVLEHRRTGNQAVFVRDGWIWLASGLQARRLAPLSEIPVTRGGQIGFQVENILAVAAAAWALGIGDAIIAAQLRVFQSDSATVPGRFNVIEHAGATIILDYGHNADALNALVQAISSVPAERRVAVYTAAGDRRDSDIATQGVILADAFDEIVVYEDQCTRGRPSGEVIRLLREGLVQGTRLQQVHEEVSEEAAIGSALQQLRRGDLLLCQLDQVEPMLQFVSNFLRGDAPGSTAHGLH